MAGVVGWVDFETADAADQIAERASQPGLIGLRPMIQDLPERDWMLGASIAPAIEAMVKAALRFDALVTPVHLPVLAVFARRNPDLMIAINHGGKPDIAAGAHDAWARETAALAAAANTVCKLSGLVTEAAANPSRAELRPYVDTLLETFGPERLMWGSDWPVLNLNGDYASWRADAESLLRGLSKSEADLVFGGTAAAFYGV